VWDVVPAGKHLTRNVLGEWYAWIRQSERHLYHAFHSADCYGWFCILQSMNCWQLSTVWYKNSTSKIFCCLEVLNVVLFHFR
jgi:hypothetical protein